jgi:predicted MPP superfamily phosphohydrolase
MLAQMFPEKNLVGLDWTQATINIIKLLQQKGLQIEGKQFNMLQPNTDFELKPGSAVMTISAMEQLGCNYEAFLSFLLEKRPELVLHHEPIIELYDDSEPFDQLALRYHYKRGYLGSYLTQLRKLERDGRIKIISVKRLRFGDAYHEGASLVVWRPEQ